MKLALAWIQTILLTSAILMLGFCGFVLADAWIFQARESHRLERARDQHVGGQHARRLPGGPIGRVDILRLGLSVVLAEGDDDTTLRKAVGHIAGTALPGNAGNVGIAGHRDTFFRPLRNIRKNDIITLTTLNSELRYRVVSTRVVPPNDVAVLESDGGEILTLVTCYPFYFVGAAPDRFIVRAERVIPSEERSPSQIFARDAKFSHQSVQGRPRHSQLRSGLGDYTARLP